MVRAFYKTLDDKEQQDPQTEYYSIAFIAVGRKNAFAVTEYHSLWNPKLQKPQLDATGVPWTSINDASNEFGKHCEAIRARGFTVDNRKLNQGQQHTRPLLLGGCARQRRSRPETLGRASCWIHRRPGQPSRVCVLSPDHVHRHAAIQLAAASVGTDESEARQFVYRLFRPMHLQ